MFEDVVVVSAARTAVGSFGGSLRELETTKLAEIVIREAIARAGIPAGQVEETVLGCVGQYGLNGFLARIASLNAGCAETSTAQTVNRLCASGLQAIVTAATAIDHGDLSVAVAGGAESMSNFPFCSYKTRFGARMGDTVLKDALTTALAEPFTGTHIAITAENIAVKYGLTRQELDEYALMSQQRAAAAIKAGYFTEEIVPVEIDTKKGSVIFDTDEHPRETSLEKLAALRPLFKKDGVVTAGNASGVNDAAAAVVLMSAKTAAASGCSPLARVVDYALAGVDPNYMGMGPVGATEKLLEKTGLKREEIGLYELNEAFAAQALVCIRELGLDMERVNVNGSGISLGHPIGATGAIISIKLINEMKRRDVRYGIATLCIGGGQGLSVLYENL
ncbi:thiolase family protein [Feifania hominis]|uniref:Acetyl-CoA acetyltransferase n=1 Tax=Feifania hominis TaxID=2763660 RepID=A0A926HT13_9FIRM|nr:thiolase family protein [Feifania hominis]MBC8535384.1 thiolase family protein [Feifania hominis]